MYEKGYDEEWCGLIKRKNERSVLQEVNAGTTGVRPCISNEQQLLITRYCYVCLLLLQQVIFSFINDINSVGRKDE